VCGKEQSGKSWSHAMMLNTVGKIVGLVLSVLFFVVCYRYINNGLIANFTRNELATWCAFLIIFGGPVLYFYANTNDRADLRTPLGKFAITGSYAVAFAATIYFIVLPSDKHGYVHIHFNNHEHRIAPIKINFSPVNRIFAANSNVASPDQQLEALCVFEPTEKELDVRIMYWAANGFRMELKKTIHRDGKDGTILLDDAHVFGGLENATASNQ
jgi:hypothetical protein